MPRPENPLDAEAGPLARFAQDLRTLRQAAGGMTYRAMAARANYSPTVLSEAASGRKLPTLDVTLAYVEACGGDRDEWVARWHQVADRPAPARAPARGWRAFLIPAFILAVAAGVVVIVAAAQHTAGPVLPENLAAQTWDLRAGGPAAGSPPDGVPCSAAGGVRACVDVAHGLVWVKDLPPPDGHHAAAYWTTTDGRAQGDCHNYLKSEGPWVTCSYPAVAGVVGFRAAVVEKANVVGWGPYVELPAG